jgi:hypothetical protein
VPIALKKFNDEPNGWTWTTQIWFCQIRLRYVRLSFVRVRLCKTLFLYKPNRNDTPVRLHTSFTCQRKRKNIKQTFIYHIFSIIPSFSELMTTHGRDFFSILDNVKILLALCSAHFTQESICTRRQTRQRPYICRELNAGLPRTSHFIAFEIHI